MDNAGMISDYINHQFLVAMPQMTGGPFDRTVTYICEHSEHGAMGLVVNRPTDLHVDAILRHMDIDISGALDTLPVLWGGPVQPERGFVLHPADTDWDATLKINGELAVTTSRDILEAIGQGDGPAEFLVLLGYAGWGGGQLEDEILRNSWLTTPVDNQILFATPMAQRWSAAGQLLGLDPTRISDQIGHA